jgi:hypothetical protein
MGVHVYVSVCTGTCMDICACVGGEAAHTDMIHHCANACHNNVRFTPQAMLFPFLVLSHVMCVTSCYVFAPHSVYDNRLVYVIC